MKLWDFLKDKGMLLLLHLVCMGVAAGFLTMTGYQKANIILFLMVWVLLLLIWLLVTYLQRRKYFREAEQILEAVDQRYLLGELLPPSYRLEDCLYREMILKSNKSVIERLHQLEDEQRDYKEYIESWVHEIKAPISGIALLSDNRRRSRLSEPVLPEAGEVSGHLPDYATDFLTISLENQRIETYVDMVLYYARSEAVYKDYQIQKTDLNEIVCEVLEKNRLLLIQNQVQAEVDCTDQVYSDRKWIGFILNQFVQNSVKYRKTSPVFRIYTKREKNGVVLVFEDNGIGIPEEEISRIFEKGFTGSNGRMQERSTGMGLYLCHKLCDKLGISISAESEQERGTRLYLEFPISNYISRESED